MNLTQEKITWTFKCHHLLLESLIVKGKSKKPERELMQGIVTLIM
jgi:hypothetical protein